MWIIWTRNICSRCIPSLQPAFVRVRVPQKKLNHSSATLQQSVIPARKPWQRSQHTHTYIQEKIYSAAYQVLLISNRGKHLIWSWRQSDASQQPIYCLPKMTTRRGGGSTVAPRASKTFSWRNPQLQGTVLSPPHEYVKPFCGATQYYMRWLLETPTNGEGLFLQVYSNPL